MEYIQIAGYCQYFDLDANSAIHGKLAIEIRLENVDNTPNSVFV
jgi:hypothetical protein